MKAFLHFREYVIFKKNILVLYVVFLYIRLILKRIKATPKQGKPVTFENGVAVEGCLAWEQILCTPVHVDESIET